MDSAQRSLNGAFDGVQAQIGKSEDIQAKNDVAIKTNNTQDFLNKLGQLGKTPEELQAAIASGAVDQLKAGYGNAINHDQVRGAAEGLLDSRYKQVKMGVDFNNAMLNEKTAPVMDKFKSAVQAKNPELIEKYRAEYAALGGKHGSELEGFLRTNTHEDQVWDEEKKGWVRSQSTHEANLKNMAHGQRMAEGQLANSSAQVRIAQGNLALNQRTQALDQQNKLEQLYGETISKIGEVSKMSAASAEGTKVIVDEIGKMTDAAAKRSAYLAFNEMKIKNPNMLTSDALSSVMGTYQRWWRSDSHIRGEVNDTADALSGGSALQAKALEARSLALEGQAGRLRDRMKVNEAGLYGNLRGNRPAAAPAEAAPAQPAAPVQPAPVDREARLRQASVEEQRRKDAVVNEFKLKADMAAGSNPNRREQAQAARVADVTENFDATVGMLKRGAPRADIQKALNWIDDKEESGVLTRAQQKQVREARKEAGL